MARKADPYHDRTVYHIAKHFILGGGVSALCYKRPRAIPLNRGQSWVLEAERATCPKCRKLARSTAQSTDGADARPS